eukprot:361260-Chlamydomonas_euryale.AAC.2
MRRIQRSLILHVTTTQRQVVSPAITQRRAPNAPSGRPAKSKAPHSDAPRRPGAAGDFHVARAAWRRSAASAACVDPLGLSPQAPPPLLAPLASFLAGTENPPARAGRPTGGAPPAPSAPPRQTPPQATHQARCVVYACWRGGRCRRRDLRSCGLRCSCRRQPRGVCLVRSAATWWTPGPIPVGQGRECGGVQPRAALAVAAGWASWGTTLLRHLRRSWQSSEHGRGKAACMSGWTTRRV